jgi:hypothetical protein
MLVGLKFLIRLGLDFGYTWTGTNLRTESNGFTWT